MGVAIIRGVLVWGPYIWDPTILGPYSIPLLGGYKKEAEPQSLQRAGP